MGFVDPPFLTASGCVVPALDVVAVYVGGPGVTAPDSVLAVVLSAIVKINDLSVTSTDSVLAVVLSAIEKRNVASLLLRVLIPASWSLATSSAVSVLVSTLRTYSSLDFTYFSSLKLVPKSVSVIMSCSVNR